MLGNIKNPHDAFLLALSSMKRGQRGRGEGGKVFFGMGKKKEKGKLTLAFFFFAKSCQRSVLPPGYALALSSPLEVGMMLWSLLP